MDLIKKRIAKFGLSELRSSRSRWDMIQKAAEFDKEAEKFGKMAKKAAEKGESNGFVATYTEDAQKCRAEARKIKTETRMARQNYPFFQLPEKSKHIL